MNFIRHLLLLSLLSAGVIQIFAAPAADAPPAVFRLLTLVPADDLFIDDARGASRPVTVSSNRFSAPIPVPKGGTIDLYRFVPAPTPSAPPVRESAIRTSVPATPGAETLVILLPRDGAPDPAVLRGPLRPLVIDGSPTAHPLGQMRVFNLSSREAAFQLGNETAPLPRARTTLVTIPEVARPWLSTAILGTEGWQRVGGGPLTLRPGHRLTLFIVDAPPAEQIDAQPGVSIFRVMDRPPPLPP
ncbi:MAG: hypothetical protein ABW223_05480, partial [Rariglobus sp.]